jgi:polyphenol oxidase
MTVTPIGDRALAAPDGARTNRREETAPLTSEMLSAVPGVIHGITRRVPGLGIADGNVGYSAPRDTADAWQMRQVWLGLVGLDPETIVVAHQVHRAGVASVSASDAGRGARPTSKSIAQADALVTNDVGVVLMTLHADCMAILLCDPVRRVVATIHAGWRGTVAGVTAEVVRTMMASFGSIPNDVLAHLGPAIGPCCYEVGVDVVEDWRAARIDLADTAIRPSLERPDRWMFDLETANRLQLGTVGVPAANIEASRICTRCQGDEWFSHRGQGPHTGRYGSFIALSESVSGVVQSD